MQRPEILSSQIVAMLPRGENNPRNSEGDFAVLKNGDILFAYSHYEGASGHDDAPCNVAALRSSDGGNSFQPVPFYLAEAKEHGVKNIMSVSLCRLDTGELCLFYLCKQGPQSEVWLRRCTDEAALSFGAAEPAADAEVIALAGQVLTEVGIERISLRINSIGCPECRKNYTAALQQYFSARKEELCDTCKDRLERNPMRILDCKSPVCSDIAAKAPVVLDFCATTAAIILRR